MPEERKRTILVVEDETSQQNALKDALQGEGFAVLTADDGESGLKIALEKQPNLILLDNRMPRMSGYTMLRQLRVENNWGSTVPVIFLSNIAVASKEEESDIHDAGAAYYLMKSDTSLADLIAKIKSVLMI